MAQGNKVNTVHSRLKILRKLVKLAVKQGIIPYDSDPFLQYKLKKEPTKRQYLSESDLSLLEGHLEPSTSTQLVLDCFLFACYSGLRFSDLCLLNKDNIKKATSGLRMTLQMSKTRDIVSFNLPKRAVTILKKYEDPSMNNIFPILKYNPRDLTSQALMRHISSMNAYFNRQMKTIAENAGLEVLPSFHQARHTFATRSLFLGIRMEVVQKLLGHADLKSTQVYAKIVDQAKDEAMELWNK